MLNGDTPDPDFTAPDSPEGLTGLGRGITEPHSDWRGAASHAYQFYVSLTQNGFTDPQALELVKVVIQTATQYGLNAANPDAGNGNGNGNGNG